MRSYEQIKNELIRRMLNSAEKSNSIDKSDAFTLQINQQTRKIYELMVKVDHARMPADGEAIECIKVVHPKRLISRESMNYMDKERDESTGLYERAFCSGMYIALPVLHMSEKFMLDHYRVSEHNDTAGGKKDRNVYGIKGDPIVNGIDLSKYANRTLHINEDGTGLLIREDCPCVGDLYTGRTYEMLY